jgi:hypothetical protein
MLCMLRDWWEAAVGRLREQRAAAAARSLAAPGDAVACAAAVAELEALQARCAGARAGRSAGVLQAAWQRPPEAQLHTPLMPPAHLPPGPPLPRHPPPRLINRALCALITVHATILTPPQLLAWWSGSFPRLLTLTCLLDAAARARAAAEAAAAAPDTSPAR